MLNNAHFKWCTLEDDLANRLSFSFNFNVIVFYDGTNKYSLNLNRYLRLKDYPCLHEKKNYKFRNSTYMVKKKTKC